MVHNIRYGPKQGQKQGFSDAPLVGQQGGAIAQRRAAAFEIADLAAALEGTQRREERELCEELSVQPRRLAEYARRLLRNLTPLSDR